jgi:hypothetical protein
VNVNEIEDINKNLEEEKRINDWMDEKASKGE